jgi:hypothetical protein
VGHRADPERRRRIPDGLLGAPAPTTPRWTLERRDGVAVLGYGLAAPPPMPIAGMAELAEHVEALAAETAPPVLVLAVGVRHADLTEIRELALGRPIRDFMPWN